MTNKSKTQSPRYGESNQENIFLACIMSKRTMFSFLSLIHKFETTFIQEFKFKTLLFLPFLTLYYSVIKLLEEKSDSVFAARCVGSLLV